MQAASEEFLSRQISFHFNMRSFDDLPTEVLIRIVEYIANSRLNPRLYLRRLQLINKRWKSVAEIFLYQDLRLCGRRYDLTLSLTYLRMLVHPERCKLVKNLYLTDKCYMALDESFFNIFSNIQRVRSESDARIDWKSFSMNFTSDRCKLKELPHPVYGDTVGDFMPYFDALKDHHQTLETLDVTRLGEGSYMHHLREEHYSFPSIKLLKVSTNCESLQLLDDVINKYPQLEELHMSSSSDLCWRKRKANIAKHHQLIRKVSGLDSCWAFRFMCTYFAIKFQNVKEWHLTSNTMCQSDIPGPFERMTGILRQIMKSAKVHLRFTLNNSKVQEAVDFFFKTHGVQRSISIGYDMYEYETRGKEDNRSYDSDGECPSPIEYENVWNIASISVDTNSAVKTWTDPSIAIQYMPDELYHLALLEHIGHRVQSLHLHLQHDERHGFRGMGVPSMEQIWNGGALAHLINNCPDLLYLTYDAHTLADISLENEIKVNRSLKVVNLRCNKIIEGSLLNLSHRAPGIEYLNLSYCPVERVSSVMSSQAEINMPHNNFELLEIGQRVWSTQKLCHILVQIVASAHREPTAWYCLKIGSTRILHEEIQKIERDNYMSYAASQDLHMEIIIRCKSIKCLKLARVSIFEDRVINKQLLFF